MINVALLIPILAIVMGIGLVFWIIFWDHRHKQLQYAERQLMIEKGMTPPPTLPEKASDRVTPEDCLRRGTTMVFLGLAFVVAYFLLLNVGDDGPPPWTAGVAAAIVGFLGIGNLVYYFVARAKGRDEPGDRNRGSS